ncbi:hypothetical protein [Parapedobacter sp. DT-150]
MVHHDHGAIAAMFAYLGEADRLLSVCIDEQCAEAEELTIPEPV